MKKYILYLFIFATYVGYSQENLSVLVEVDTTQIRIGEQIQYKITVDKADNVVFPSLEGLGKLEIVSEEKPDTIANQLIKKYVLTGFDSGSYSIPKQQIFLQDKSFFTDSLLVHVATVTVDTLKQKQFPKKPIVDEPVIFDDYRPYFIWLYLLLGLILLGGIIYFIIKRYYSDDDKAKKEYIPPYQEAIEKLSSLDEKELWQNNMVKEYYSELTEIVRTYIGREVKIHTLEATTEELILMINKKNKANEIGISRDAIKQLEAFLKHADFVKFAKLQPPAEEIRGDRSIAGGFVETVQPVFKQYKYDNLLADDDHTLYLKAEAAMSTSEKRKRTLIYSGFFIAIVAVLTTCSMQVSKYSNLIKASIPEVSLPSIESSNWEVQSFGTPALTLHSPFDIALQTDEVPQQAQAVLTGLGVYSYNKLESGVQIAVTALTYGGNITPDAEQVVQSSIKNLQNIPNLEGFEYDRKPAQLEDGLQGTFLSGAYNENGIDKIFNIIAFARNSKVWQVITVCNKSDEETQTMLETMIGSINIEKE
jgi:hypothetical protein